MKTGIRILVLAAAVAAAASPGRGSQADLRKLYDPIIQKVAAELKIDAELLHAVIRAESNYDRFAISNKGAMGLMQLMPATVARYDVMNVFDPADNIGGGARYLKELIALYGGRTELVLAAYNAGQEAVKRYRGIPPYPETRAYISRVQATYDKPVTAFRRPVYKYYDENGRLVITTEPREGRTGIKKGG
jgi:soluble lytic murein transglycosylase-like protein